MSVSLFRSPKLAGYQNDCRGTRLESDGRGMEVVLEEAYATARARRLVFRIENVIATEDKVTLVSENGNVIELELDGDCCSASFFDDFTLLDVRGLIGDTLLSLVEVEDENEVITNQHAAFAAGEGPKPRRVERPDADATLYYALIIKTDRQSITMDWRNESNGYYSGSVRAKLDGQSIDTDRLTTRLT